MTTTPHPTEPDTPGATAADGTTPLPVTTPAGAVTDSDATAVLPQTPAPESGAAAASDPAAGLSAAAAPLGGAYQAPQAAPPTAPPGRTSPRQRPLPRTGPIVWGALILVFCGYVAQRAFGSGALDGDAWVIATLLGLGAILLAVGAAVIIRNRRR